MKLKYRLFLWIGSVFFVLIVISAFFDGYVTRKNIQQAQIELRAELIEESKQTEENIESFLRVNLSLMLSQVDTVLARLVSFAPFRADFAPNPENLMKGTWPQSASLLLYHPWADFIQSATEDQLLALVSPVKATPQMLARSPQEKGFALVQSAQETWIGIEVDLSLQSERLSESTPAFYILFTPEAIRKLDLQTVQIPVELPTFPVTGFSWLPSTKEVLARFLESIAAAQSYLAHGVEVAPAAIAPLTPSSCQSQVEGLLYARYQDTMVRGDELLMIWAYSTLLEMTGFGNTPFAPLAPAGIARFGYLENTGRGFFANQVFGQQKVFSDAAFFQKHQNSGGCDKLSSGFAVIAQKDTGHAFLANTLRLAYPETSAQQYSYLTLGMDIKTLLMQLALSLHQTVLLVHEGQIVAGFDEKGVDLDLAQGDALPLGEMLSCRYGVIPWRSTRYFYQNLEPLPGVDLHFFTFNEEAEQFALIQSVQQGAAQLAADLTRAMRYLAIVALFGALLIIYRLAARFTSPIAQLAQETTKVASGHFDDICLPAVQGKHDEIAQLIRAFQGMIKDLKEKEKVKGILNKIVSPQIAAQILAKGVELGGQKRCVTVLFADIRGFTAMTQHQAPEKTIQMLNSCMTHISGVIDQYGGVIDKYIGDAVMALFNAPLDMEHPAYTAVCCALAILQEIERWDKELCTEGAPLMQIGIGIHTGDAIAGNMGAINRLNYTVIGSNINLASRICSQSSPMELLISEETFLAAGGEAKLCVEKLAARAIKGFDTPIALYRVISTIE